MAGFTAGAISDSIRSPERVDKFESRDLVTSSNDAASRDPWIFREGRRTISGLAIVRGISSQLQRGSLGWVDALIQAGELEAALADAAHPFATFSADLTDALASAVCTGNSSHADRAGQMVERLQPPEWVSISPPEGFTYYALHPLDFARVICRRAERQVATLKDPNPEILRYLNRLSDFWWLLARYMEKRLKQPNSAS